jgi:tetratricopeptide (TPR) repeat protein
MHKYLIQLIFGAATLLLLQNCESKNETIAKTSDYSISLEQQSQLSNTDKENLDFWGNKLTANPNQFPYMAKLAVVHETIFTKTGTIDALFTAADYWEQVNEMTAYGSAGYLRSAAKNAITRHEFKLAYDLLKIAQENGEKLKATKFMLFDACLELGKYTEAEQYLNETKDFASVDYLIRLAKWEDTQGNLNKTILLMKDILAIARQNKNKELILWTVTNLGDYYGHDGNIKASYESYLEALSLDPKNKYAKKGIAYIAFAHDNNPKEALRIINTITQDNLQPDDLLFMADLAAATGDSMQQNGFLNDFTNLLAIKNYGELYNIPLAQVWLEKGRFKEAIKLLQHEVSRRQTPEVYGALANAYHKSGDQTQAYQIIKEHVQFKTFEPSLLLIEAQVLKAMGKELQRVKEIKEELMGAIYELGPLSQNMIEAL